MAGLKTITVFPEDIIKNALFMLDSKNRLDLLGQILFIGYNIKVHPKKATPACQFTYLPPFTTIYRNIYLNTPLTLALLHNAKHMDGTKQVEAANIILEPHNIYLEAQ